MDIISNKFIYIVDDTGFNKDNIQNTALKQEKACFCGIIINKSNYSALLKFMAGFIELLEKRFDKKEFHFTEIVNNVKGFETLDNEEFLEIVDCMIGTIHHLGCDVIIQSISDFTYKDTPYLAEALKKKYLTPMQTTQTDKSNCLVLSILRAKRYIEEELGGKLDYVVCDEGIRKANNSIKMPSNVKSEKPIEIQFKSSKEFTPLQLADFVAWSLSRQKQTLEKDISKWSNLDFNLMDCFSDLENAIKANTIMEMNIDRESSGKVPYDTIINLDRRSKGLDDLNI